MMIALCFVFPVIAYYLLQPMLYELYGSVVAPVLSASDMYILLLMLVALVVVPVIGNMFVKNVDVTQSNEYMAGINTGDNKSFVDSFDGVKTLNVANWYFTDMVNEQKLLKAVIYIASAVIIIIGVIGIGGAL